MCEIGINLLILLLARKRLRLFPKMSNYSFKQLDYYCYRFIFCSTIAAPKIVN